MVVWRFSCDGCVTMVVGAVVSVLLEPVRNSLHVGVTA